MAQAGVIFAWAPIAPTRDYEAAIASNRTDPARPSSNYLIEGFTASVATKHGHPRPHTGLLPEGG